MTARLRPLAPLGLWALALPAHLLAASPPQLPGPLSGALDLLVSAVALATVLLLPGWAWLPLWRRLLARGGPPPAESRGVYLALATLLGSYGGYLLVHAAVLGLGLEGTFAPIWAGCGLLCAAGVVFAPRLRAPDPAPAARSRAEGPLLRYGGAALLLALVVVGSPPRFVAEPDYLPEEIYDFAARLDFTGASAAPVPRLSVGPGLSPGPRGTYLLQGRQGELLLELSAARPVPFEVPLLLRNRWPVPLAARLSLDGRPLEKDNTLHYDGGMRAEPRQDIGEAVYLYPPYRPTADPRNAPPALRLLAPRLELPPGRHTLLLEVFPLDPPRGDPAALGPRASVLPLAGLDAAGFYRRLRGAYFIGDTGDIRETLDFAGAFRRNLLQQTSSYAGDRFDGGGPTSLSDEPPGHHFLCYLAQTFRSPQITSISWLWLADLALLWLLGLHLAARKNPGFRAVHALVLLLLLLGYSRLCRLGLESNAPDTLLLLLLLALILALYDGRRVLVVLLGVMAAYVHIPATPALGLLALASVVALRSLRGAVLAGQALLGVGALFGLRLVLISAAVGFSGALYSGQAHFLGANRLDNVAALLTGRWHELEPVLASAAFFGQVVFIASGGALTVYLLALPWRRLPPGGEEQPRGLAALLFAFGLLYGLAFSLVDAVRAHHLGPILLPLGLAALRRVTLTRRPALRSALWLLLVLGSAAGLCYLALASPDPTGTLGPFHLPYFIY